MRCEASHGPCAAAGADVSPLVPDTENELRWIPLSRLPFMFVWPVPV
jgi:hypothetical protein